MNLTADSLQGHEGWRWQLSNGDSVFVARQGAQVLSWCAGGEERLFLSPKAACDGSSAIRGGIPICFPQFNQRGSLPKHGFVRNMPWHLLKDQSQGEDKVFEFVSNENSLQLWPVKFRALLTVSLSTTGLKVTLAVQNLDTQLLTFSGALHTYLAIKNVSHVRLLGQVQQPEWDAVKDAHQTCSGKLHFNAEFDRVYDVAHVALDENTTETCTWLLQEGDHHLQIAQSNSWGQSVVWNPGAEKCAQLADMPQDAFLKMLCVEAARVTSTINVQPAHTWEGWQQLRLETPC